MEMLYVSNRLRLTMRYPASWWHNRWREALPSGNGRIGAAVYGGVHKETILLNHEELWYGGKKDVLPDVSDTLEEVRKLMFEKKYKVANDLLCTKLTENGYSSQVASILPFADIKVSMPVKNGFTKYLRFLDMETGQVGVSWKDGLTSFSRNLFVSRAHDMIVYEIKADKDLIDASFSLSMHDFGESSQTLSNDAMLHSVKIKTIDNNVFYSVQNDDGTDFGAVMRIVASEGVIENTENEVAVKKAKSILVLTKLFVKGKYQKDWLRLKQELDDIDSDYNSLLDAHVCIHQKLFNSSSITLYEGEDTRSNEELLLDAYEGEMPISLAEKMWAYGRYLFISSTRQDSLPCTLYGLWCGDYNPWWSAHVANENVEMIHWHAGVGGLSELMGSLFNYYDGMMEDFRQNARMLFGCRGINISGYTSPGIGLASVVVPVIINWTGAAGWLAHHYFQYYLYTGDFEFLIKRAIPFMEEAALFYEDFLVDGENDYYSVVPSVSPENSPAGFHNNNFGLTHPMPTAINATMDIAIIRELFTNLIRAVHIAGDHRGDDIKKWKIILDKIPPYEINDDDAVKEWLHPEFRDNYNHRHLAHLYPVFPGHEVTRESNPVLFDGFVKALAKRMVVGINDQSGWSLVHMACTYARMEDGNAALECLNLLSRSCLLNNFLTTHNDWREMGIALIEPHAPMQIDANMGWVNTVQEMLLQVYYDSIVVLPALPDKWKTGSVKNLHFHTGKISFKWDLTKMEFHAELFSERETDTLLRLPVIFSEYIMTGGNISYCSDNTYSIKLRAGEMMEINSQRQD